MMLASALPTFAIVNTKATGNYIFTAYTNVQRASNFSVEQTNGTCDAGWNLAGSKQITFTLGGNYTHDVTFSQNGTILSGSGGYPAGGPHIYEWAITSGSVVGTAVNFTANYTLGADALIPLTTMHVTGTISTLDGSMSGTWDDNYQGGLRNGTWSSQAGTAVNNIFGSGCDGKGIFNYGDGAGNAYMVKVKYVKVSGNTVWFAGPVTGTPGMGPWLFAKAQDIQNPFGSNKDIVWGSFMTESQAKNGVATMGNPPDGPFIILLGNIKVF